MSCSVTSLVFQVRCRPGSSRIASKYNARPDTRRDHGFAASSVHHGMSCGGRRAHPQLIPSLTQRDNASVFLDVLLSWRCVNPKAMLYSSLNTPLMIGKMLQAQIRAVAGALDVDALIEEVCRTPRAVQTPPLGATPTASRRRAWIASRESSRPLHSAGGWPSRS